MKLAIGNKDTRKFKVTAEEAGDFLEVTKHVFDVEFKIIPKSKLDSIRELALQDMSLIYDDVKSALVWIGGVKNEDGSDASYNAELKDALFDISWVYQALVTAFWTVQNGTSQSDHYKALKAKN